MLISINVGITSSFVEDVSASVATDLTLSVRIVSCYHGNSNGLSRVTVKPRFRISAPGFAAATRRS